MWDFNVQLITLTNAHPGETQAIRCIDASAYKTPEEKDAILINDSLVEVGQQVQLSNPDSRVAIEALSNSTLLSKYADGFKGLSTGDSNRFIHEFWEVSEFLGDWAPYQGSVKTSSEFSGRSQILLWEQGAGAMVQSSACYVKGARAWGAKGISITQMSGLPATLYEGQMFDENAAAVIPFQDQHRTAIYCFVTNKEYKESVRQIDSALKVTNKTLVKVPFDLTHWQKVAAERYPNGLPKPYSDDPTQWIFHGHPQPATDPLKVAVARLLGYRWPAESDAAMELSSEARAWIARCKDLSSLVDDDGILCLPAVRGEAAAVDRLRAMLVKAFGTHWTAASEAKLLKDVGCEGLPLSQWLRDKFFEQHVARFQKRPFILHVWDGHKDGFSALLNYHTLTRAKLQTLIHTYLGDWITQQRRTVDAGGAQAGEATMKLAKAEALKVQLEAIAQGEKPFDIFVRWKPLAQQPIGWEPDLNDGVRTNIRPFVEAGVLRIPRAKLGIKWESDRGKDVASAPWFKLGPTYGEPEGTRINDHHLSLAQKQAARAAATKSR